MKWIARLLLAIAGTSTFLYTTPLVPEDVRALKAYETMRFDTPDGDLGMDEYAIDKDGVTYIIREIPKDEGGFYTPTTTQPVGKKLVDIVCEKCEYYAEFPTNTGKLERKKYSDEYKKNPMPTEKQWRKIFEPKKADAAPPTYGGVATSTYNLVSSVTFSFTTAGSELGLIGSVLMEDSTDTDRDVTLFEYASSTLTKRQDSNDDVANLTVEMWTKQAPASGANNVQVNTNGTVSSGEVKVEYVTGASQTHLFDVAGGTTASNITYVSYTATAVSSDTIFLSSNIQEIGGTALGCSPFGVTTGTNFTLSAGHDDPTGIATTTGFYWVSDDLDDEVYKYNDDGTYASVSFDTAASGAGDPQDIAYATSTFYIIDDGDDEVYEFTTTGTLIRNWDTAASGATSPRGIAYADGHIFVTDSTAIIYKFTPEGSLVTSYDVTAHFSTPNVHGLFYANGKWYVLNSSGDEIGEFTSSFVWTGNTAEITEFGSVPQGLTYYGGDFILMDDNVDLVTHLYAPGFTKNHENDVNGANAKGCGGYQSFTSAGSKNLYWACGLNSCSTSRDWASASVAVKGSTSTPAASGNQQQNVFTF